MNSQFSATSPRATSAVEPLVEGDTLVAMRLTHPKVVKKFNSWLVGGEYHRPNAILEQSNSKFKEIMLNQTHTDASHFKEICAARREQARLLRSTPCTKYVAKLHPHGEVEMPEKKATGSPRSPSKEHKRTSSPTGAVVAEEQKPMIREEVREQLMKQTKSKYKSLFPPLYSPIERRPNFLRGNVSATKMYYGDESKAPNLTPKPAPPATAHLSEFSVLKGGTKSRVRIGGRSVFMPTGSLATPYRVFTNYKLALEMQPLSSSQPTDQMLREVRKRVAQAAERHGDHQDAVEDMLKNLSVRSGSPEPESHMHDNPHRGQVGT